MQSDSVYLSNGNPTSSGYVSFELLFDLTVDLSIFPSMDRNSATLLLMFEDIDFKTDVYSEYTLNEVLEIQFRADPGGPASGSTVTIDDTNYWNYSGMAANHDTDNVSVTYEVNLKNDLGISEADFLDMEADKDFALWVTFDADLAYTGRNGELVNNSSEALGSSFALVGVPEPATLTLLAVGGGLLIRRRRKA